MRNALNTSWANFSRFPYQIQSIESNAKCSSSSVGQFLHVSPLNPNYKSMKDALGASWVTSSKFHYEILSRCKSMENYCGAPCANCFTFLHTTGIILFKPMGNPENSSWANFCRFPYSFLVNFAGKL